MEKSNILEGHDTWGHRGSLLTSYALGKLVSVRLPGMLIIAECNQTMQVFTVKHEVSSPAIL